MYLHGRADSGEIFYVGKGTRTHKKLYARASEEQGRNAYWKRIAIKHGYLVTIVADFFAESDAFAMETELIGFYGRKINGGTLCNLTDGGEGSCGIVPSQLTREKLSIEASKPRGEKWIASIRAARKNGGNGGVVCRGDVLPESWRRNIAVRKIGELNPMYGKTGNLSAVSRPVIDLRAGVFYNSVDEAANHYGYKMKTLYNWLSGHRRNPTSLEFA